MSRTAVRNIILAVAAVALVVIIRVTVARNAYAICGTWCGAAPQTSNEAKFSCLEQCIAWCTIED